MAIYIRKDGVLFVQFQYKGKTYIKSSGGKNKAKAQQLEAKMRQELYEQHELGISPELKLTEAFEFYLKQNQKKSRYGVIKAYSSWFKPQIKNMFVHDVTTAWFHKIIDKKRAEGTSEGTLRNYIQLVNGVVKSAKNRGYRTTQYVTPRTEAVKGKLRYLTLEEEQKLLNCLNPNHPDNKANQFYKFSRNKAATTLQQDYDVVLTLLDTGCRKNEIFKLKWSSVDLDNRIIHVWRTKVQNESLLRMTDRLYEVLKRRFSERTSEYVFNDTAGGFKKSTIGIETALKHLGLEDVTLHTLRHTFAVRMVQNNVSLYEVSKLLGHSNILQTSRYAHLDQHHITSKAVDVLNNLHGSQGILV